MDETEKNSVSTQPATTQVNSTAREKKQPVASSRYEDMKKAILEEDTEKSEVSSAFYLKSQQPLPSMDQSESQFTAH